MKVGSEDFSILLRNRQHRRSALEKHRLSVLEAVFAALETLSDQYAWEEAYLFGSLTRPGCFGPESDVDIAIAGLNKFDHYALVGDISNLLDRTVDVVRLEECPFAAKIAREGISWKRTRGR
jgi:hypothetical protein